MSNLKIRTRYAPSPTGFFHIGGARTALFNYLFAKHNGGDFIVRIEDTDIQREVEGGIDSQLTNLKWMGIIPDESIWNEGKYGPYIQSKKLDRYQELAYKLLQENKAYRCFCTEKELQEEREQSLKNHSTPKYSRKCLNLTEEEINQNIKNNIPFVIRLKIKDNTNIEWNDLIRGHMTVPTSALTDPVILKSNGYPMYNFAVVVDDYDMKITHVLRGEEHLSNTPYQIMIKQALGFDSQPIEYGHLSIITNSEGKKLSKRDHTLKQFIEDYKSLGIMPKALTNFLSLLGWTPNNNKEILSLEETIKEFDLSKVSKSPACFDFNKLLWISNQHIKLLSNDEFIQLIKPFVKINLNEFTTEENFDNLLLIFKPQIDSFSEINDLIKSTFNNMELNNLSNELKEFIKLPESMQVIKRFKEELSSIISLTFESSTNLISNLKNEFASKGIKNKSFFLPLRIVSIGKEHGPEMNKIITIVGKEKIINNINKFI